MPDSIQRYLIVLVPGLNVKIATAVVMKIPTILELLMKHKLELRKPSIKEDGVKKRFVFLFNFC